MNRVRNIVWTYEGFRACVVCAILVVFCGIAVASAQPTLPDNPPGRAVSGWLAAFNSGDRAGMRTFMLQHAPARVKLLDSLMDFRQATGGFVLRKVEQVTPTKVVALVQEQLSDQFARLAMEVASAPPHHITHFTLLAIPRPPEFALPHLSQIDLLKALRSTLASNVAADHFAGAVLVAKDGKPIFEQAYGLADREHKIPNTLDTRFRIGSMNKMFTAVSIMQLVQAGKIGLQDRLGKYLTDYPNKTIASQVTIQQLLTHTGGTGDFFGPAYDAHRLQLRTLQDYIKLYGSRAPMFKPGSRYAYSNYGFILLGAVIEKVTGQSYYDYVHDHVYMPAGMTATASEPENRKVPTRSIGYTQGPGGRWQRNTDTLPYRGTSAGGGYTTVGDLLKFANALQSHTLLDAAHTELTVTGKVNMSGGKNRYGYGFGDLMVNGTRCFGHNGGAPGMNGALSICPVPGYVIVVLANMDPAAADNIETFITNRLPTGPQ